MLSSMDTRTSDPPPDQNNPDPPDVIVRGNASRFLQEVVTGKHHLRADEPQSYGGGDAAPGPYDYLLIGLGVCTSMTIGLYARRKQFPLENITVSLHHSRVHAKDCEDCETKEGMLDRIDVAVELTGSLTPEQRTRLMEIGGKCPVHRTLKSEIQITLRPDDSL
jgi:putative redox protein